MVRNLLIVLFILGGRSEWCVDKDMRGSGLDLRSRVQKFPACIQKPRQMENAVRDI